MKKLTIFIGVLLLLVLQTAAYPQVIQQWTATYNGPGSGNDAASKVAYDASGNVYIAGCKVNGSAHSPCNYQRN